MIWTWAQAILAFFKLVGAWLQNSHDAAERQAGRDDANASTRAQDAERVDTAHTVEVEAEKKHQASSDDSAFDTDFRRD